VGATNIQVMNVYESIKVHIFHIRRIPYEQRS
jgi:hypothetical protein